MEVVEINYDMIWASRGRRGQMALIASGSTARRGRSINDWSHGVNWNEVSRSAGKETKGSSKTLLMVADLIVDQFALNQEVKRDPHRTIMLRFQTQTASPN